MVTADCTLNRGQKSEWECPAKREAKIDYLAKQDKEECTVSAGFLQLGISGTAKIERLAQGCMADNPLMSGFYGEIIKDSPEVSAKVKSFSPAK